MAHYLRFLVLVSILTLGWTTIYGVKPSGSYNYQSIVKKYPNVKFERVTTPDKYKLMVADIAPLKDDKNVIILICYADSGNIQKWLGYGMMLSELGYRTMMFDYRGFGNSDKFRIDKDTLYYDEYITDANTVFNHLKKKYPESRVGLFGMSMGSIMTTSLARNLKGEFIIGDSYITDLGEAINLIEKRYKRSIKVPFSASEHDSKIFDLQQPILLMNGKYDSLCYNGAGNLIRSSNVKEIAYYGGHLEGPASLHEKYFENIDSFIQQVYANEKPSYINIAIKIAIAIALLATAEVLRRRRKRNRHPEAA